MTKQCKAEMSCGNKACRNAVRCQEKSTCKNGYCDEHANFVKVNTHYGDGNWLLPQVYGENGGLVTDWLGMKTRTGGRS